MTLSILSAIFLAEGLIVGWSLAGGLLIARLRSGARARRAASRLVERVSSQRAARIEELKALLVSRRAYDEAQASTRAVELGRLETHFYQAFIDSYLEHDHAAIAGINVPFETVIDAWRGLAFEETQATAGATTQAPMMTDEQIGRLQAELAALKEERDRLLDELGVSMETMGQMLDEYTHMASGNDGSEVDRGKILSMFKEEESDDLAVSGNELIEPASVTEETAGVTDAAGTDTESLESPERPGADPETIDEISLNDLEIAAGGGPAAPDAVGEEIAAETPAATSVGAEVTAAEPPPPVDKIAELELDGDLGPEQEASAREQEAEPAPL